MGIWLSREGHCSSVQCFLNSEVKRKKNRYYMVRTKRYEVNTYNFGWRITLFIYKVVIFSSNIMKYGILNAIYGPFGFRTLYGKDFQTQQKVNQQTGKIEFYGPYNC